MGKNDTNHLGIYVAHAQEHVDTFLGNSCLIEYVLSWVLGAFCQWF